MSSYSLPDREGHPSNDNMCFVLTIIKQHVWAATLYRVPLPLFFGVLVPSYHLHWLDVHIEFFTCHAAAFFISLHPTSGQTHDVHTNTHTYTRARTHRYIHTSSTAWMKVTPRSTFLGRMKEPLSSTLHVKYCLPSWVPLCFPLLGSSHSTPNHTPEAWPLNLWEVCHSFYIIPWVGGTVPMYLIVPKWPSQTSLRPTSVWRGTLPSLDWLSIIKYRVSNASREIKMG